MRWVLAGLRTWLGPTSVRVGQPSRLSYLAGGWRAAAPGFVVALALLPAFGAEPPVSTVGFLNAARPEAPGTLLSHPAANDSATLGRTTTINYVNGWLIVGGEGPGSAEPYDLIKRVYDIADPANPVRRYPLNFGLNYPGNFWIQNTDGWNAHGSAQSGPYLLPLVMRVPTFGGPVELGGQDGIPNLGEMALGYNRSSQAGPWEATMLWYGTPNQQMQIRRVGLSPGGAAQFHTLATFDHVGAFGGGDWHPMFFGDRLIYARSGGAARDGVVVYRLEYHDPNADGVPDSVTPHFVSSLPGGFEGYWPNLFSDGTGLYVIGSATDILTSANITAAASAAGGPVVAGPTLTIPGFSNASYPVYQDQFGFIHNRKINMTQFLAGQGMGSIALTLDEAGTGVDTTQISLPLGNLWITGGYPNPGRTQGMGVWVHQQAPDTTAPTVAFHVPQANRANYPRLAPLSFLLHEHPRRGGLRNGIDFTVRPVGGDGTTLGAFVPGYLIHDFAGVLTFTPSGGLAAETTYQVDFLADTSNPQNPVGFQDTAGNVLAPYSFRFATGGGVDALPAPQFTGVTASDYQPLPGETFAVNATANGTGALEFRFNFDGTWSDWAAHSTTNHAYAAAGRNRVLVQVRDASGIVVTEPLNLLVLTPPAGPLPTQSSTLAVGDDGAAGRRVWAVNPDANTVTVLNATTGAVVAEHAVGQNPRSVARDALGRYWVTCMASDEVRVLNPDGSLAHNVALPYGSAPFGVAPSPDGQALFVSLYGSGRLRRYAAANPAAAPLDVPTPFPTPRALAVSGDGQRVLVTRFISPELAGEVGEFSGSTLAPVRTFRLASANPTDGGDRAAGVPNHLAGLAISPDGTRAAVVSKQDNVQRGTFFGVGNLTHETTVRAVVSFLDLGANQEIRHARRDFDNSDGPSAVAYTPLGDTLLVTLQGNNRMVGLDALNLGPVTGNPAQGATLTSPAVKTVEAATGLAPQGLVVDDASRRILVQNFMGRSVTVLDGQPLLGENRTSLPTLATPITVGTELLAPAVLTGKRIFYNAADPRMSADSYISCASCHLDGGSDGRVWDFTGRGEGLRRTTDLRGRAGTGHGNVHWTGNFDEIQDFEHDIRGAFGGTGFLNLSPTDFAANHPSPASAKAGLSADLDALAAYVSSLDDSTVPRSPFRTAGGLLAPEAAAGRGTFLSLNCQQCHGGANLTDSAVTPVAATPLHAVGTASQLSGQRLGQSLAGLDTPTLRGLHTASSYLHHGQAATLAEVFRYAGGTLWLASQGELVGTAGVTRENDTPAQGGGGSLRGAWGGSIVNVGGVPGNGVRFLYVDGGPGGPARLGLRHIFRGVGPGRLRVNGVEQAVQFLPQAPDNGWMTSGWRWVTAEVELEPGPVNLVEVLRGMNEFADFQFNALLVSHAGDLAATLPHRVVDSLPAGTRNDLFAFLRSLDGTPVSLTPVVPLTGSLMLAPGQVAPFVTGPLELDLTFSRAVPGLAAADFIVSGSAGGVVESVTTLAPGLSYRVRLGGFVRAGSVALELPAGAVVAAADGVPNAAVNSPAFSHVPAVVLPAPRYRWSFNQSAGAAPAGTVLPDVVAGLPLQVRGLGATFDGARLTLPGTTDSAPPDTAISAYLNLPNGVISAQDDLTVELWAAPLGVRNWGSLFEFGRLEGPGDGAGAPGEWTGTTVFGPAGSAGRDLLSLTTSWGLDLNAQRQVLMTGGAFQADIQSSLPTTPGQTYHYVVTVSAQGGTSAVAWYRDGTLVGTDTAPFLLSALSDVNNWFGRSHWSSLATAHTAYDEIRLHDRVLTPAEMAASRASGPDAVAGNQPPVAEPDLVPRTAGRSLKIPYTALLANDHDPDGPAPLTVMAVSPRSLSGVPLVAEAGFVLYPGRSDPADDGFTYVVSDGVLAAQATVTIRVTAGGGGVTLNLVTTAEVAGERVFAAAGIPGRTYRLQRADGVAGPWENVSGPATVASAGATGAIQLRDGAPPSAPLTFYRVIEVAAP